MPDQPFRQVLLLVRRDGAYRDCDGLGCWFGLAERSDRRDERERSGFGWMSEKGVIARCRALRGQTPALSAVAEQNCQPRSASRRVRTRVKLTAVMKASPCWRSHGRAAQRRRDRPRTAQRYAVVPWICSSAEQHMQSRGWSVSTRPRKLPPRPPLAAAPRCYSYRSDRQQSLPARPSHQIHSPAPALSASRLRGLRSRLRRLETASGSPRTSQGWRAG